MRRLTSAVRLCFVIFSAAIFLYPIVWIISTSFMGVKEFNLRYITGQYGITLIPWRVTFKQYYMLMIENYRFFIFFWNSVLYAFIITAMTVVVAVPAAFVLAKIQFRGRDMLLFLYIIIMMMPFQVTLVPNYIQLRDLGLLNTIWSIILPAAFSSFSVFLLRQYFLSFPDQIIESARLETNSVINILLRIVVPMSKPAIAALMIVTFAECWNLIEQPYIFLINKNLYPLSLVFGDLIKELPELTSSAAVIYITPVCIMFFLYKEFIASSLGKMKW